MTKHWKVSSVFVNNAPNEIHITTGKWGQPSIAVVANESDAAYIVRCVNSHEALVEALRRISKVKPDRIDHVLDCVVLERAATIASEALKLAGEV